MIWLLLLPLIVIAVVFGALAWFTANTARKVEAALPPTGRFVDVPGARLHVVEHGAADAPALLLLHGLAGSLQHWTYGVAERLAPHYRVIAVDRPGSGWSERDAHASAALPVQADALVVLMDQLGLARPFVVGHSLGGALALHLALRHPQRVAGLALVAPLTHLPDGTPAAFRSLEIESPVVRRIVGATLATPLGIAKTDEILGLVFGPEPAPADFATRGGGLLSLRPSHFVAASADMVALPDVMPAQQARYGEIGVPVSVLFARGDRILDPQANGEGLVAARPGTTLTLVEGGHMLPVTQPARTAQFIDEAAQQVYGPRPPA